MLETPIPTAPLLHVIEVVEVNEVDFLDTAMFGNSQQICDSGKTGPSGQARSRCQFSMQELDADARRREEMATD